MTVCIGAISPEHNVIIAVSDMMLSNDESSIDVAAVKSRALFGDFSWWALYAGLPTEFDELMEHLGDTSAPPRTLREAMRAVESAYDKLRQHLIERRVLSVFGLTHEKFLKTGVKTFGESYFRELSERCNEVTIQTDILVMGFDGDGVPHIFEGHRDGSCVTYDRPSFHAIGTGAWAALGSLFAHNEDIRDSEALDLKIYRLCEAKFVSEIARSVGPGMTLVQVIGVDGSFLTYHIREGDPIRNAWFRERHAPLRDEALKAIAEQFGASRREIGRRRIKDPERSKPS